MPVMWSNFVDGIAGRVGIWALRRLFGADCPTDIKDDFPGEDVACISCDATRLVAAMRDFLDEE